MNNRIVLVFFAIIIAINAFLVNDVVKIKNQVGSVADKVAHIEGTVSRRESADPLTPSECSIEPGLGDSKIHPCRTTFERLLLVPQKFHGRWIIVSGIYSGGFESSALYPLSFHERDAEPVITLHHSAIWVEPSFQHSGESFVKVAIIGKFYNGPSGHLSAYFGKIINAEQVSDNG